MRSFLVFLKVLERIRTTPVLFVRDLPRADVLVRPGSVNCPTVVGQLTLHGVSLVTRGLACTIPRVTRLCLFLLLLVISLPLLRILMTGLLDFPLLVVLEKRLSLQLDAVLRLSGPLVALRARSPTILLGVIPPLLLRGLTSGPLGVRSLLLDVLTSGLLDIGSLLLMSGLLDVRSPLLASGLLDTTLLLLEIEWLSGLLDTTLLLLEIEWLSGLWVLLLLLEKRPLLLGVGSLVLTSGLLVPALLLLQGLRRPGACMTIS